MVMRDPGLDDDDVAEIFGRTRRWAAAVRSQSKAIRAAEPIPNFLEYLDEHLQPDMPSPAEIAKRAEKVRDGWHAGRFQQPERVEIKAYIYGNEAFTNLPWSA